MLLLWFDLLVFFKLTLKTGFYGSPKYTEITHVGHNSKSKVVGIYYTGIYI